MQSITFFSEKIKGISYQSQRHLLTPFEFPKVKFGLELVECLVLVLLLWSLFIKPCLQIQRVRIAKFLKKKKMCLKKIKVFNLLPALSSESDDGSAQIK